MRSIKRFTRLNVEVLEDRCTPSTYTVTNFMDAGTGSLRQAILNANKHPGKDTVVFKAGMEGTIKLTSGHIYIADSLFLDGPGASKITIDGNQNGSIFYSTNPTTMDGLTLVNGKSTSYGGAIQTGDDLHLSGMVIMGNSAATDGGGVYGNRSVTIQGSKIIGNSAGEEGGGISARGTSLIDQCTISGNWAGRNGGGIHVNQLASVRVRRSTVSGNSAATDGGGIYADDSAKSLTIEKSTIDGNQAGQYGGGVMAAAPIPPQVGTPLPVITVTDSKIRYNVSESTGGGLASNGATTIRRSTISGNVSRAGPAGGISQYSGSLLLIDSTVSGNRAENDRAGGILIENTTAASTIRRSTIAGNWAKLGAGAYVSNLSELVSIEQSTISGNVASQAGGGVYVHTASVSSVVFIYNSTIAFNRADTVGGGIWSIDLGNPTKKTIIMGSTIVANNDAPTGPDTYAVFFAGSSLVSVDPGADMIDDAGQGVNLRGVDPRLAPLAGNGGLTQTHALRRGSPAINMGTNRLNWTTDQRGGNFARKVGPAVDIGAFEWTKTPLPTATAGTFTVSNRDDSGAGSLRQAVIDANNHPGFDKIVFKPGLEGTIKLTSGEIEVRSAMFIDGPGSSRITVDGNQSDRIFGIFGPVAMQVTIDGLTLFNGHAINSGGGAVFSNADLRLIGTVLTGNLADEAGGAIFSENLTLRNSRISGNEARDGGGISARGKVLIDQSTISNNSATDGGGVYVSGGNLTVRRSTVSDNSAQTDGGGIGDAALGYDLIIEKSTIQGNQAGRWGGGVRSEAYLTSVSDSTIRYNISESTGGGLAANYDTQIRRSTVSGNISRNGPAGGISQYGGALQLFDSTVSGNRALNGNGGGVYIEATEFNSSIRRSTIAGNTAAYGAGAFVLNSAPVSIQNSTLSGNMATETGGGLYSDSNGVSVQNSTVAFNRAKVGSGIASFRDMVLESSIVASVAATLFADLYIGINSVVYAKSSITSTSGTVVDQGNNQFDVDPRLAPLGNNGGRTQTHALKKGSPAINKGSDPANLKTDQRGSGFKRKLGPKVDIGAFERE
ncbi:MAG: right-handed parallel beta-helix repeat-containing protein [Planctomycetes bacterium]|nr:right-handed parallel beta-helix repeat-containing protein [Planctomycetota bacterium]